MTNGYKLFIVGMGAFIGAILRYICEITVGKVTSDPFAILVVNVAGCFIIGLFTALVLKKLVDAKWNKFVTTGFCGGLTTFSSFAHGISSLFLTGHVVWGIIYVFLDMFLGLGAVYLGFYLVMRNQNRNMI